MRMPALLILIGVTLPGLGSPTASLASEGSILVFGGTGRLGAPIVRLLLQVGEDVTVFARKDSTKERLAGLKVDYVTGDLTDEKVSPRPLTQNIFGLSLMLRRSAAKAARFRGFMKRLQDSWSNTPGARV